MRKDLLASGNISATFIPDKTVSQGKWDEAFKGSRKKKEPVAHKAFRCKDCPGEWDTAKEFSDHIAACNAAMELEEG